MKIIRQKELAQMFGVSLMSIHRWEQKGELPPKIQIGPRTIGWLQSDIEEYLASRRRKVTSAP
jgi:prophage regulatory protein